MTDLTQTARELLDHEMGGFSADDQNRVPLEYALLAIESALARAAPEGFVLVPTRCNTAIRNAMGFDAAFMTHEEMDRTWQETLEAAAKSVPAHVLQPDRTGMVTIPRELTTAMLEAADQEYACGNEFPEAWEAAIATYIFDKENGNG